MTPPNPDMPYNDLPALPPAPDLESKAVLRKVIATRTALAELKQSSDLIPNTDILINNLTLLEAQASSEIENIVTTTDQLFQYSSIGNEGAADPSTKEALRYRSALYEGFQRLSERPLNTNTAITVCSAIKDVDMQVRRVPGTALRNSRTGAVIYTPPEGLPLLQKLLTNWESYMNEPAEIDPVVRMAVAHYQFEAIHPFSDGNGRTGRVLNTLFLVHAGLLTQPTLYLSREINLTKQEYYDRINQVTFASEWEAWIIYMLAAVEKAATWTCDRIRQIRELTEATIAAIREKQAKLYSRELVDVVFAKPYCRIDDLVTAGIAKRQTASVYLKKLVEIGVLQERTVGRDKIFINVALVDLLTRQDDAD